jgi:hypothetical protein
MGRRKGYLRCVTSETRHYHRDTFPLPEDGNGPNLRNVVHFSFYPNRTVTAWNTKDHLCVTLFALFCLLQVGVESSCGSVHDCEVGIWSTFWRQGCLFCVKWWFWTSMFLWFWRKRRMLGRSWSDRVACADSIYVQLTNSVTFTSTADKTCFSRRHKSAD